MSKKAVAASASILMVGVLGLLGAAGADERDANSVSGGKSAEVVKIDADAGSITVKLAAAEESAADPQTLVAEGKAVASLKDFKSGDKVVLTCKEGTGTPQAPDADGPGASIPPCVVTDIAKVPDKE